MTNINERITTKLQELLEESRQDLIQSIGTDGEEYAVGVYEGIERALVAHYQSLGRCLTESEELDQLNLNRIINTMKFYIEEEGEKQ